MSGPEIGAIIPDIEFTTTAGATQRLSDYQGRSLVLYFYPKASTPGCTQEGLEFKAFYDEFQQMGCAILGVSRDSLKAQSSFKDKQGFPFDLAADTEEQLCAAFDVIRLKNMYGKQVRGIERSTFLIDANGILKMEWRKVKVKDHVATVFDAVKQLGNPLT